MSETHTPPGEQAKAALSHWLSTVETLIKSLDFLGASSLPPSFRHDLLDPVKADLEHARTIANYLDFLEMMDHLNRTDRNDIHRPWFFWEQVSTLLADFVRADRVFVFHALEAGRWTRIHPPLLDGEVEIQVADLIDKPSVQAADDVRQQVAVCPDGDRFGRFAFVARSVNKLPKIQLDRVRLASSQAQHLVPLMNQYLPKMEPDKSWTEIKPFRKDESGGDIIGSDPRFLDSLTALDQAADSEAGVFLKGESGTGKELFARRLHLGSPRREGPFIAINCSAVPHELIESEMFGHEKGAFTGAYYRKIGKVEQAHGGTLFLDEIGEMPLAFQAKLLRYLQDKTFTRVGGTTQVRSDARIVVATHRDLQDLVSKNEFREDLFYRIHVIPVEIPPLRERGRDIRILAEFFFRKYISRSRASRRKVDDAVYQCLERHAFPGNVRELENIIQRTVVMAKKPKISVRDLPKDVQRSKGSRGLPDFCLHPFEKFDQLVPSDRESLRQIKQEVEHIASTYTRDLERRFLLNLLHKGGGSARQASELAGINRTLFYKLLKRAGIDISVVTKEDP